MSFPPIEPTTFDLIVVGTGLPESVIAAAASTAGKTVLHLDPNPFYGGHFSSLPLHDLTSFLHANSQNPPNTNHDTNNPHRPSSDDSDDSSSSIINLTTRPLYSAVEILSLSSEPLDEQQFRKFNIDLAGPRVFFCADSAVDLMLKSNANRYIEFKNIEASLICDENGNLRNVPDSRSAIFKDKTLAWSEKNQLMSFFKLVQGHFQAESNDEKISEEDLESPFAEFLNKMRLPSKIKSYNFNGFSL